MGFLGCIEEIIRGSQPMGETERDVPLCILSIFTTAFNNRGPLTQADGWNSR